MAKAHFILQGKGGVGKSFAAIMLWQFLKSHDYTVVGIDTDPANSTFHGFDGSVQYINVLNDQKDIDASKFDAMLNTILTTDADHVIVDTGASSFIALMSYLASQDIPGFLAEAGHDMVIHTAIVGGSALKETIAGFDDLTRQLSTAKFIVWANPYWGPIESDGKKFEEFNVIVENKDRIAGIVRVPSVKAETFGRDLREMLTAQLSFDDAAKSSTITQISKHRLGMVRKDMFLAVSTAMASVF